MATFTVKEKAAGIVAGNSWDIFRSLEGIARADQASLWLMGFNAANVEIFRECALKGGTKDMFADLILILRRVVISCSTAWACVYNHTSGICRPKDNDIQFAYRLYAVSELVGLTFFDCIIIADDGYFSFRDQEYFTIFEECAGIDLQRIEKQPEIKGMAGYKVVNMYEAGRGKGERRTSNIERPILNEKTKKEDGEGVKHE